MDRWDVLILAVAGYVAVMTLTRLMTRRRNELVEQSREQIASQMKKKKKQKKSDRNAA
ncbi:hypothetical protein [Bythopirellula polymerisocia]|uniref:Uncharacterized protein n=1 Tax=Bythopirellula polymerisocia TaxID=2528003 RepID=A0A5C6D3L3_9BACT|nr:hypothetical protein [Bythopirellula polymerisocia]TWU30371.1 hypothetical protein Pla144_11570 [Bythopirellula polymerisocia]